MERLQAVCTELDAYKEENCAFVGVEKVCKCVVHEWSGLGKLQVKRLIGGVSNVLYKVEPLTANTRCAQKAVIVRIYGTNTSLRTRAAQCEMAIALNREGFGAKVLGKFLNGLVEEYIESEAVDTADLLADRALLRKVARTMSDLHFRGTQASGLFHKATRADVPLKVESQFWNDVKHLIELAESVLDEARGDIILRRKWNGLHSRKFKTDCKALHEIVRPNCDRVKSPDVFCHNDVHAGNLLYDRVKRSLTLIDYEYAGLGPRGFDLANFFCEFAGFECDCSKIPDRDFRRKFLSFYLGSTSSEEKVASLEKEVKAWVPVTYFFWALWAILQHKHSSIGEDYLRFANLRLEAFRRCL